jgi:beta-ribofuranosylaminobenzene 5'-phosphate synthase
MSFVEVAAPSRLHFGLLSFGQRDARNFGGAGVMVDKPGLRLRFAPAEQFETSGPLGQRVRRVVERFAAQRHLSALPACAIDVLESPPQHVGLGTGTQLSLSVVAGLHALSGGEPIEPAEMAELSGRAFRSAVGTYGFVRGGMIAESGKLETNRIAPLERRIELPAAWRFLLIVPRVDRGLSGKAEYEAFDALSPVPATTTAALHEELTERMFPAAERGDFDGFSHSLYRYGYQSGMCFAARQGGPFAGPSATIIDQMRALGIVGVGQSSWGPTVFAAVESPAAADDLRSRLVPELAEDATVIVTAPNNQGATVTNLS